MITPVSRMVDALLSRGEGLDARGDPFAPPLGPSELAPLHDAVRDTPAAEGLPFESPLPPPGGSPRVEVRTVGEGATWAIVAPHYGSLAHPTRMGVLRGLVRALVDTGHAVALVALPYHGSRAPDGRPSGWGYVRADLAATQRAVLASAAETMALARHLRDVRGAERLVGVGLSLGAAGLGLAAAHGAPFDAVGVIAGVDNPASFYATGENRAARRATLAAAGLGEPEIEAAFAPVSPSSFATPLPPERLAFAIPALDGVVPPRWQEAWCARWSGQRIELPRHGHGTAIASGLVASRLVARLA